MLFAKTAANESVVVRRARVLDPAAGIDSVLDVRLDDGVVAALGTDLDTNAHRVIEAEGLLLAPAFVDPHVHLRTPGREDEETIASGTAAAAAGGYCAILAMPNTDPVVDSAATLGSLIEAARAEAEIPVGFLAAITKAQQGAELSEMGQLADAGAAGFSDDGMPVASPGLMRRALQYGAVTGRRIALRGNEPVPWRPDARRLSIGRAGLHRLSVSCRDLDCRARPRTRRVRAAGPPPLAPVGMGVGASGATGPRRRRRRDGRGHTSP